MYEKSKTIKHVASLARIKLTDKEEEKISGELSIILGYIDQLNNINTDDVEPLYQVTGLTNSTRADEYRGDFSTSASGGSAFGGRGTKRGPASGWEMDEGLNEKLIGQAPVKEGRFIKVKSVLNK